jgi:hypothetical protein
LIEFAQFNKKQHKKYFYNNSIRMEIIDRTIPIGTLQATDQSPHRHGRYHDFIALFQAGPKTQSGAAGAPFFQLARLLIQEPLKRIRGIY